MLRNPRAISSSAQESGRNFVFCFVKKIHDTYIKQLTTKKECDIIASQSRCTADMVEDNEINNG